MDKPVAKSPSDGASAAAGQKFFLQFGNGSSDCNKDSFLAIHIYLHSVDLTGCWRKSVSFFRAVTTHCLMLNALIHRSKRVLLAFCKCFIFFSTSM